MFRSQRSLTKNLNRFKTGLRVLLPSQESCMKSCHDDLNLAHMEKESSPLLCHPENSKETLEVAIEDYKLVGLILGSSG